MEWINTLNTLCHAFGPSGAEGGVAQIIEEMARPYVDEITRDTMGNLICLKKGSGPRLMFSAHMDSIGLVVTHIDDKGFLRVGAIGGVHADAVVNTPVRFQNGTCGVIAAQVGSTPGKRTMADLYLDIGATSREEAEQQVQIGDVVVYNTPVFPAGALVAGPYMDNRISCLVLLQAMERLHDCPNDVYFVFSTQEEVGLRGAKTAAWSIDPDYGIAVDVTSEDGIPGAKHTASSLAGQGAAVKVMDRSVICHPEMVNLLMELAQKQGIPAQRDVIQAGGTDAGAIHQTRSGVCTGGISIPCRYTHTPCEMVCAADVEACVELVAALAQTKLEKEC